jgi:DNA-binding CsgD family transcriptional regulator
MNMEVMAFLATVEVGQGDLVNEVAHLVCASIADSCAIAILSDDGRTLHPLGLFDRRGDVMAELEDQAELYWQARGGTSAQALRTGEPVLITRADPEALARGRPLAARVLGRLETASGIVAPMRAGGTSLGVVAVGRTNRRNPFQAADVPYVQGLADNVALGLANARLRELLARRRHGTISTGPDDPAHDLTDREREVLVLIGDGLTNREIGERLYLSVRTVEWHRSNMSAKLGVTRRSELIAAGRRLAH